MATGDGADELFCGYDRIFSFAVACDEAALDGAFFRQKFLERYSYTKLEFLHEHLRREDWLSLSTILEDYFCQTSKVGRTAFEKVRWWFLSHHLFWLLRKSDYIAGQYGLESRAPYLHPELWEMASSLTARQLVRYRKRGPQHPQYHEEVKGILKAIFRAELPFEILQREKLPFPVMSERICWLTEPNLIREVCSEFLPEGMIDGLLKGAGGTSATLLLQSFCRWRASCRQILDPR